MRTLDNFKRKEKALDEMNVFLVESTNRIKVRTEHKGRGLINGSINVDEINETTDSDAENEEFIIKPRNSFSNLKQRLRRSTLNNKKDEKAIRDSLADKLKTGREI